MPVPATGADFRTVTWSVARKVRDGLAKLRSAATSRGIDTSTLRQNMQYGLSMVEKAV